MVDLAIFYFVTPDLGEAWTAYSWFQVFGMAILLYGTSIYNAPNAGSISLKGQWYALGLDFRADYAALEDEKMVKTIDDEFEGRMLGKKRTMSSFRGDLAANLR